MGNHGFIKEMINKTSITIFQNMRTKSLALIFNFLLACALISCSSGNKSDEKVANAVSDTAVSAVKWKVATIAYTFRKFTFFEAVTKTKELGLNYIGGYPGQLIGGDIEGNMTFDMDPEKQQKVLKYLSDEGIKLIDFGVITPKTDEEWRQLFAFAKAMGIENIVSEPRPDQLKFVSDLCDEFKINVAIHNHPAPSHYWNPDTLLAAISGLSPRVGACADVGHWVRSGLDPVESLKKLDGRILELHFKDESELGKAATEVVWGTGVANVKGMLEELHRQNFNGFLSIEYESKPEDNMKEIAESIEYYNKTVSTFQ
jgi:sugar phosphate isomerase/epimerase